MSAATIASKRQQATNGKVCRQSGVKRVSELFEAINRRDASAVREAIAAGADVNAKHDKQFAVEAAIQAKQPDIALLLIESGAKAAKMSSRCTRQTHPGK